MARCVPVPRGEDIAVHRPELLWGGQRRRGARESGRRLAAFFHQALLGGGEVHATIRVGLLDVREVS